MTSTTTIYTVRFSGHCVVRTTSASKADKRIRELIPEFTLISIERDGEVVSWTDILIEAMEEDGRELRRALAGIRSATVMYSSTSL